MFEPRNKIWVGVRRQGKTLTMVYHCIDALKHRTPVYSNVSIKYQEKNICYFSYPLKDVMQFLQLIHKSKKNLIVALDEIGLMFPNQYWNRLDIATLSALKQSGHVGVALWGTTHSITDVVGKLRALIDDYYLCKKVPYFGRMSLPHVKSWRMLVYILFHPWHIMRLFPRIEDADSARPRYISEVFDKIPSFLFRVYKMNRSWTGKETPRSFYDKIIWTDHIYPRTYKIVMKSYDTQQWMDYQTGMVKTNQAVSRRTKVNPRGYQQEAETTVSQEHRDQSKQQKSLLNQGLDTLQEAEAQAKPSKFESYVN